MTQQKHPPTPQGPFGLTGRDILLLAVLVIVLALGLIPAYQLVQRQSQVATSTTVPSAQEIAQAPTSDPDPPQETATQQPTVEPTQATATPLPPTSTAVKPTPRPTNTPPPTPTLTPTESPSATPTATNLPTVAATLTPTATATLTQTATDTLTSTLTVTTTTAPVAPAATPSPQPATIVYVQGSGPPYSLGIVTSTGQLINDNLHRYAAAPTWSPDGTKIAFFGEPGINTLGGVYLEGEGIWLIDPQAGNPRQLFETDHVKNLAWSPDGSKLAYEFGPPDSTHEIVVIDAADGREFSRFFGEQPTWSPDSQKLIIKACLPDCGLWQVNLDGRGGQQITFYASDSYPTWSHGGNLAFTSEQDGNWEIYLLQPGSKTPQRLTDRPSADITPVFSPDGQEIYLRTNAFDDWRITAMDLDGSNERPIKEGVGPSNEWGLARPAVH